MSQRRRTSAWTPSAAWWRFRVSTTIRSSSIEFLDARRQFLAPALRTSARNSGRMLSYEPARCVVCGHTDAVLIADQDDIRAEVEALWEFHQSRLKPATPPERL